MSFGDLKISEAAIQSTGVQSQPDTLTGSAPDNKLVFDALPTLIIQKLNSLLDLLGGTGAAGEMPITPIDGMTATTVQQALAELRQALTAYINLVQGTNGAAQVGVSAISGMTAQNAQAALAELKAMIDNLVIGALPSGSVTADMIADGAIVQLGALLAVAAAAAYDPEGSYAVGDYCTHGGKLHKCGTEIPDGEEWNAEHWTETSVAAELVEVRASLSNKAASTLGQITENDLLTWADKQTLTGAFGINPSITTEGVPTIGWYHGFLEVKVSGKRMTLTESSGVHRTWTNCTSSGNWTGWVPQATATPPEVDDLPLANGVLGWARYMLDSLGNVTITGVISFTTSPTAAQQILILPEGIRPLAQVPIIFQTSSSSSASMYGYIQPSGTIQLANNTPPTGFTQNASIAMIAPIYSIKSVQ